LEPPDQLEVLLLHLHILEFPPSFEIHYEGKEELDTQVEEEMEGRADYLSNRPPFPQVKVKEEEKEEDGQTNEDH